MNLNFKKLMKPASPADGLLANEVTRARGFTLIELLVVIAIIGLLSSIVLASLSAARAKAADAAIQETLIGIRSSAEIYFGSNGDKYGLDTGGGQSCLNYNNPATFFGYPPIKNAIKYAYQQNGSLVNSAWCSSNVQNYGVAVGLKTQTGSDPYALDYFCVDSSGAAKFLYQVGNNPFAVNPRC